MTRAVIYARYSSEGQREASIDDQVRNGRRLCDDKGWQVVEIYADRALSGASPLRPGFQKLMADARDRTFDVVVAEGLDRLSREQVTTAMLFRHLSFLGIMIFTRAEGEVNELHVGLKGTMNALFLKDSRLEDPSRARGAGAASGLEPAHRVRASARPASSSAAGCCLSCDRGQPRRRLERASGPR
jgi:hypothetical protein